MIEFIITTTGYLEGALTFSENPKNEELLKIVLLQSCTSRVVWYLILKSE